MRVSDDQYVLVPLYHGTSKRFLPSIRGSGLGGTYPCEVSRCHQLLDDLAELEGWDWSEDPDLCILKPTIDCMRARTVTAGGFNFRYGGTYVFASCRSAVRYATSNRYGSELLSNAMAVLDKLFDHDPTRAQEIAEKHQICPDLRHLAAQPVLVEANQVPIRILKSERGDDASVQIERMQQFADKSPGGRIPVIWDQMNFELIAPVPSKMLHYYDIHCDSRTDRGNFTLQEIP
ncbi:MAG: hypothetical protein OXI33_04875 [Chloroflexota bacterium]|nr:hypothetical protein [Chloroflexota bacterium]